MTLTAVALRCAALAFVLIALLVGSDTTHAAPGDHVWSAGYPASSLSQPNSIVVDSSGNVVVVGTFSDSIDLGGGALTSAGATDVFVAKFDGSGTHIWSKRFGDVETQLGLSVATDSSGSLFVAGESSGTVDFGGGALTDVGFLAKLDADGDHVWSTSFNGNHPDVAIDATGSVAIAGAFSGSVDFGGGVLTSAGAQDAYVAKFDSTGAHLWSQRYGDGSFQFASAVAVDGSSNVLITGGFVGTIDFGGGPLVNSGPHDLFVAKLDVSGAHVWSDQYGAADGEAVPFDGGAIATDASGNVVVGGIVNASSVDFGGGPLTGGSGVDIDIFLVKFDSSGAHAWSHRYGTAAIEAVYDVDVSDDGNVVMTGYGPASLDVGGGALSSVGAVDVFVATYEADGDHAWSKGFGEVDVDNDGCSDIEELGAAHLSGGQRDPSLVWDFYDVNGTQKIDAVDLGLVRGNYNPSGPVPPEDAIYDRGPGAAPWAPGAPDNKINAIDIGTMRASFGDSCVAGQAQVGTSVAFDGAGDVTLAGRYEDAVDLGGGPLPTGGMFVATFDGTP